MSPLSENINRVSPKMGLQGPRPSLLKVCKDSYTKKIKKPQAGHHRRQEVVIHHLKSPEIFHTKPQDFMLLVQQLTGNTQSSLSSSSSSSYCSTTTQICGLTVSVMGDDQYISCSEMKSFKGFDEGEEKKEEYLTIPLPSTPSPGFFIW